MPPKQSLFLAFLVLTATVGTSGCRDRAKEQIWNSSNPATATTQKGGTATLDTIIATLQPLDYELDSPRDIPVLDMIRWADANLDDMLDPGLSSNDLKSTLEKYADSDFVNRTMRNSFVLRDAVHARDSIWASMLAQSLRRSSDTVKDTVVRLFYHVVHDMVLITDDRTVPLGPFNSMLFGRGKAEDRAWVFAMLAGQIRVPICVLECDSKKELPVIAAAFVDEGMFLFDMTHGIPIAKPADVGDGKPWIESPATLEDVLADDDFFADFSTDDFKYPLKSVDLKSAKVKIIGDSSLWSRRLEGLNNAMAGKTKAVVARSFMSYGKDDDRIIGDLETVQTGIEGMLPTESISIWMYPERQRQAREQFTDSQSTMFKLWRVPLAVPRTIKKWEPFQLGPAQFQQQKARAHQITGDIEQAIPIYMVVQQWDALPPLGKGLEPVKPEEIPLARKLVPPAVLKMHMLAAERAFIWRATSQMQDGSYRAAAVTFDFYLRQYTGRPRFEGDINYVTEARYLAGLCEARRPPESDLSEADGLRRNLNRAIGFVDQVIDLEDTPNRSGAAEFWSVRWRALIDQLESSGKNGVNKTSKGAEGDEEKAESNSTEETAKDAERANE